MKKFMSWLEDKVLPIASVIEQNKYISSVQYGIMLTMPLLLVGAFACIISEIPFKPFQDLMVSILGEEIWYGWNWDVLNPATFGLIALVTMLGTSYELARKKEITPLPGTVMALMSYFILIRSEEGMIDLGMFGASALFLGIIVAIISVEIYDFCLKKKLTIKMPDSVPVFVKNQFAALTPAVICALVFLVIRYVINATAFETAYNLIYGLLQAPLASLTTSFVGTLIISFINSFLWFFGIHGTNVVDSVMAPLWYAARDANFAIYQTNALAARPFIVTQDFANLILFLGGTGLTLPLAFEMMFMCKSKRVKTIGKGGIIPGLFNVNEPIIFGLPLVMNPVMAIPFILVPLICVSIAYGAMYFGFVPYPTGVVVPWTMPPVLGGWMMCDDIRGGLLQLVIILVSGLIYYPFIKTLDKKYLLEEEALEKSSVEGK